MTSIAPIEHYVSRHVKEGLDATLFNEKLWDMGLGITAIILGYIIAKAAAKGVASLLSDNFTLHQKVLWSRLCFYGLFLVFMATGFRTMGFKLDVLLGAAGIFTVAIGFASQTSASNLISGLFLIGERSFVTGDTIRVDKFEGEVMAIDLLSVKLKTADNTLIRVPNEQLIKTPVTNLTRFGERRLQLDILIGHSTTETEADSLGTADWLTDNLMQLLEADARVLKKPAPQIMLTASTPVSINGILKVWVRSENYIAVREDIMRWLMQLDDKDQRISLAVKEITPS